MPTSASQHVSGSSFTIGIGAAWPGRTVGLNPEPRCKRIEAGVNEVNAAALAKRQGIAISESRSQEMQDYVSLIELRTKTAKGTSNAG